MCVNVVVRLRHLEVNMCMYCGCMDEDEDDSALSDADSGLFDIRRSMSRSHGYHLEDSDGNDMDDELEYDEAEQSYHEDVEPLDDEWERDVDQVEDYWEDEDY